MLQKVIDLLRPPVTVETKLTGIATFIGSNLDKLDSRLRTQEIRSFQKGEKGDIGIAGKDGRDGKDGKDGVGIDGKDGKAGKDGKNGKDGVGVESTWIAADGHLVVKLSNGKEIDAGDIGGIDGKSSQHIISTQLPNNQVYVSATAPPNPSLNDLWYDLT